MKQLYLKIFSAVIMLFLSMTTQAQSAYYLHLKGGGLQVFYTDFVDSMTVSRIDNDGVEHDDYVTQQFWMADSVFQYPLADIDSISFVTPETILQPGVIDMADGLIDYVTSADTLSFTLSSATPDNMLPRKGDKVVFAGNNSIFPFGFAGNVEDVDNYKVECSSISLRDVYIRFYSSTSLTKKENQTRGIDHVYEEGTTTWSKTFEPNISDPFLHIIDRDSKPSESMQYAVSYSSENSIRFTPKYRVHACLIIDNEEIYLQSSFIGENKLEEEMSFTGAINTELKIPEKFSEVDIPIYGCPFFNFYVTLTPFVRAQIQYSGKTKTEQSINFVCNLNWSSSLEVPLKNSLPSFHQYKYNVINDEGSANGKIQMGILGEIGIKINDLKLLEKKIGNLYVNIENGIELVGNRVLLKTDYEGNGIVSAEKYSTLYDTYMKANEYRSSECGAKYNLQVIQDGVSLDLFRETGQTLFEYHMAPKFSDMEIDRYTDNLSCARASVNISGKCPPYSVGFAILDKDNQIIKTALYDTDYNESEPFSNYHLDFDNIATYKEYSVRPMLRYNGNEILADISANIEKTMTLYTEASSDITSNSASLYGKIVGADPTNEEGYLYFCYNTTGSPSKENGNVKYYGQTSQTNDGLFYSSLEDLTPNTKYYYVAAAEIDGEMFYGDVKTFQTMKAPLTVTTLENSRTSSTTAILNGRVENITEGDSVRAGFEFGTNPELLENVVTASNMDSQGNFQIIIDELLDNTYYYRAFANGGDGIVYGDIKEVDFYYVVDTMAQDKLLDFYKSSNGEYWDEKWGWCADTAMELWHGLQFRDGHLELIELSNNNLTGCPILDLTGTETLYYCSRIDLSNNKIRSFSFKNSFGQSDLDISNNKTLHKMVIENELPNIVRVKDSPVKSVSIRKCNMDVGATFPYFDGLTELDTLSLSENTGELFTFHDLYEYNGGNITIENLWVENQSLHLSDRWNFIKFGNIKMKDCKQVTMQGDTYKLDVNIFIENLNGSFGSSSNCQDISINGGDFNFVEEGASCKNISIDNASLSLNLYNSHVESANISNSTIYLLMVRDCDDLVVNVSNSKIHMIDTGYYVIKDSYLSSGTYSIYETGQYFELYNTYYGDHYIKEFAGNWHDLWKFLGMEDLTNGDKK